MTTPAARRFRHAHVAAAPDGRDGHVVRLDNGPLQLPDGAPLDAMSEGLANAIAAEWEHAPRGAAPLPPDALPLFRLAATRQARVAGDRDGVIASLLRFADADGLRHRATGPEALRAREHDAWQPALDRVAERWGAVVTPVTGVMPEPLPAEATAAFGRVLAALDDAALAVLLAVVPPLGSLVLGLLLVSDGLAPAAAVRAATVDAEWNAERWGEPDAVIADAGRLRATLDDAVRFLALARAPA